MKRKGTKKPQGAIPTLYRGTTYRSRFEARVAQLLDELELPVLYEAFSILLPGGVAYIPDFQLRGANFFIEARGYKSKKGDIQLEEFPQTIPDLEGYAVFREEKHGGSIFWKGDKWSPLCLNLERPVMSCRVVVKSGEMTFVIDGHALTLAELKKEIEKRGGTTKGAKLGGRECI